MMTKAIITTLLLFLTTTFIYGQVDPELGSRSGLVFFDSLTNGTADYNDKRILFINDSAGYKMMSDKAAFDKYMEGSEKGSHSILGLD